MTTDHPARLREKLADVRAAEDNVASARAELSDAVAEATVYGGLSFSAVASILGYSKQNARKLAVASALYVPADERGDVAPDA